MSASSSFSFHLLLNVAFIVLERLILNFLTLSLLVRIIYYSNVKCDLLLKLSNGNSILLCYAQFFTDKNQDALFKALQKLKEGLTHSEFSKLFLKNKLKIHFYFGFCIEFAELMLLGFISLLLTVSQGLISKICVPENVSKTMLPCKHKESSTSSHFVTGRHLLSGSSGVEHCSRHKVIFIC